MGDSHSMSSSRAKKAGSSCSPSAADRLTNVVRPRASTATACVGLRTKSCPVVLSVKTTEPARGRSSSLRRPAPLAAAAAVTKCALYAARTCPTLGGRSRGPRSRSAKGKPPPAAVVRTATRPCCVLPRRRAALAAASSCSASAAASPSSPSSSEEEEDAESSSAAAVSARARKPPHRTGEARASSSMARAAVEGTWWVFICLLCRW